MKAHWKRGIFLFKTPFHSSRYDFRLPRYRRAKEKVIFNRLLPPFLSLIRVSRSHLHSPTYPKLQTSDRRDSWKNVLRNTRFQERNVGRGPIHVLLNILLRIVISRQPVEISGWTKDWLQQHRFLHLLTRIIQWYVHFLSRRHKF